MAKNFRNLAPGPRPMKLSAFGRAGTVIGGPYRDKRPKFSGHFGIKLAPEVSDVAHVELAIPDFGVASDTKAYRRAAEDAVVRVLTGEPVYVGCMMGQGRTGTFLAVMAKLAGEAEPVAYVRNRYNGKAVETRPQEAFVDSMPVFVSRVRIRFRLLLATLSRGRN